MITLPASKRRRRGLQRLQPSLNSLYEWFYGFSDAESSFYFRSNLVEFKIGLQKDDLAVLLFIQEKLGKVDISSEKACW